MDNAPEEVIGLLQRTICITYCKAQSHLVLIFSIEILEAPKNSTSCDET